MSPFAKANAHMPLAPLPRPAKPKTSEGMGRDGRRASPQDLTGLWRPRFAISPQTPIATYGTCFAQSIGPALRKRGYTWVNAEPPAGPSPIANRAFHYGLYSSRTGPIATPTLLAQWVRWAAGRENPPDAVWKTKGSFQDAFRPGIEPDGFATRKEARHSRRTALSAFTSSVETAEVLWVTLGAIEHWHDERTGMVYPASPKRMKNFQNVDQVTRATPGIADTLETLSEATELLRKVNPKISVLLSVSPTRVEPVQSGQHVLAATMHAKSVLRTACAELVNSLSYVDYLPAYEVLTAPSMSDQALTPERHKVTDQGVTAIVDHFIAAQNDDQTSKTAGKMARVAAVWGAQ